MMYRILYLLFAAAIFSQLAYSQFTPQGTNMPYENSPIGFASVNALGQNGTTGGAGGDTITFTNRADMQVYLFARAKRADTTPKIISVYGTITKDATDSGQVYVKGLANLTFIGMGTNALFDGLGMAIVNSRNIIVRNIEFRNCKPDCITVNTTSSSSTHHIWIDHCTFSDNPEIDTTGSTHDGLLDITHRTSYVTVSWCKFTNHRKTCLLGYTDGAANEQGQLLTTYHNNWFKDTYSRHPRVRHTLCHVYNNYYDGTRGNFSQMNYGIASTDTARVLVEGCYFKNVLNPTKTQEGNSPPGNLLERANIFESCGQRFSTGIAFEPNLYYAYEMLPADSVPAVVSAYAGSGRLNNGTPQITLPLLITGHTSTITQTSAQSGGAITYDGGAQILQRGVCWSTNANPTLLNLFTSDGQGTGSFTSSITGLSPSTTYHVRAYATNSRGTAYGGDSIFTTAAETVFPTVSTSSVTGITTSTAICGGTVVAVGGSQVTERGVCWAATANPTINSARTIDGSGAGGYSSNVSGLQPGTMYYIRAYATNLAGTAYGQSIQFMTQSSSSQPVTAQWVLTSDRSATVTGHISAAQQILSAGGGTLSLIVKDYNAGTTGGGQKCHLGTTSWPNESTQNDGRYQQYDISPLNGYGLFINQLLLEVGYAATSYFNVNIYYSTDGWLTRTKVNAAVINPPNSAWTSLSYALSSSISAADTFSVRIYPWLSTTPSTTKYLCVRNLSLSGTTATSSGSVTLTLVPQGLYNAQANKLTVRDTFNVYLANTTAPFAFVDSAKTVIDSVTFTGTATFSSAPDGNYYIVVTHRNTLETWSRPGGESFQRGGNLVYNFSDSSSRAFGNNLILVGNFFCLYSGDINQDGTIDFSDLVTVDNDSYNYVAGYVPSDVNGDNFVDFSDVVLVDNVSWVWPQVIRPSFAAKPASDTSALKSENAGKQK